MIFRGRKINFNDFWRPLIPGLLMSVLITFAIRGFYVATRDVTFIHLQNALEMQIRGYIPLESPKNVEDAIEAERLSLEQAMSDGLLQNQEIKENSERITGHLSVSYAGAIREGVRSFAEEYVLMVRDFWFYKTIAESKIWILLMVALFLGCSSFFIKQK
jgi:hypothetical protein